MRRQSSAGSGRQKKKKKERELEVGSSRRLCLLDTAFAHAVAIASPMLSDA